MATFDAHANFAYSLVAVAPSPATSGGTLEVTAGTGARFPAAPFNCTVWPPSTLPLAANAEIVRVTAVVGDVLTITRNAEGPGVAKSIAVGWQIAETITAKVVNDLQTAMEAQVNSLGISTQGNTLGTTGYVTGTAVQYLFVGGPNITLSQSRVGSLGTLTISGPSAAGAQTGISSIVAADATYTSGQVVFSGVGGGVTVNSNTGQRVDISVAAPVAASDFVAASAGFFGTNVSGTIASNAISVSAAATVAQSNQTLGLYASSNTYLTSSGTVDARSLTFRGDQSITVGISAGEVAFSVGAYLTTARRSTDAIGLNTAQTNVTWTVNSSGLSLNAAGYAGTGVTTATTAGTALVGTLNTVGLSLGVPAFLTTARGSTDAVGLNTAQTNVTWTVNSSGLSLNAGGYAGTGFTSTTTAGTEVKATNNTAGLSMAVPAFLTTQSAQFLALTLAGNSLGTSTFAASNNASLFFHGGQGITLSGNGSSVTFSVGSYITTARASTDAIGLNTAQTNVTWTVNSAGLSLNAGGYAGTGFTSTTTAGVDVKATNNTSGLSLAVPAFLTTAMASNRGSDFVQATAVFNGTNATGTIASGAISISVAAPIPIATSVNPVASASSVGTVTRYAPEDHRHAGIGAVGISTSGNTAGTTGSVQGTYWFQGGANLTVSQITSNNGSHTLVFSGATAAPSPVVISAGTVTGSLSSIVFSDSNQMAFGLNGSTITAAAGNQDFLYGNTFGASSRFATVNVHNLSATGNISIGATDGYVVFSVNPQTNQSLGLYASSNTTLTSSGTADARSLSLRGIGGATIGVSASEFLVSVSTYSTVGTATTVYPVASANSVGTVTRWAAEDHRHAANDEVRNFAPYLQTNTAGLALVAGSFYFVPFAAPGIISGGRLNFLFNNTSTAGIARDVTATGYASNTTGTKQQSYSYSLVAALYSLGSGTNSTRLESIWSNSFSFGLSGAVRCSVTGGNNSVSVSNSWSISYIQDIGSDGAYTLSQFASNSNSNATATALDATALNSVGVSIRNMLSNSVMVPVGFNTTISAGQYVLGVAWSSTTASAATNFGGTGGASALMFSHLSVIGISQLELNSAYRNWGSTATTARSQIVLGAGAVYTGAANLAPPSAIAISSDLSSVASQWMPYFNVAYRGLTK